MTEGEDAVRRKQRRRAEKQLRKDLENLDKIVVIPDKKE